MTKNISENLIPDFEFQFTTGEFILETDIDILAIRDLGLDTLGAIYLAYGSTDVAAFGLERWVNLILKIRLEHNGPIAIRTYAFIPDPVLPMPNHGKMTKERLQYFKETCKTKVFAQTITGKALRLYKDGKDSEAIRAAFDMNKGA